MTARGLVLRCLVWGSVCASWAAGCQTAEFPAPIVGSTYRIEEEVPAVGSEVRVDLLTTYTECANTVVADPITDCLPRADRSSGELRLAFKLRDTAGAEQDVVRAISADQIRVTHDRSTQADVELIPHEPKDSGQLYILLIDGSGSMHDNDQERIRKVYSALLKPSVVDGFFPKFNSKTGVVLLTFNDGVRGLDGGSPRVITDADVYRDEVRNHLLNRSGGYTHLFKAVRYAMTELPELPQIRDWLLPNSASATLIVLTDGFNNEERNDACGDNAPRLQETLELVREVRTNVGGAVRPTVYTVGLGQPYRPVPKDGIPSLVNQQVTAVNLCGPRYMDTRIDGGLEEQGIDHVSMRWLAEAGGGLSFVKRNSKGLAEVFEKASATRYRWYEVWYRVPDSFYHRKSFQVELQLLAFDRALSTVKIHPNPWLDAPPGDRKLGSRWHIPAPFRRTLALIMPILGVLVLLNFSGPAWFNARRAVFRRARPRRRGE